jgi:hypothetical protein
MVYSRDQFSINVKDIQQRRDNALKTGAEAPEKEELQQLCEAINI